MSDKRKFLIENFETVQKARARKPHPLSYEKIAKILSANGMVVSTQLVKAVCKEHEDTRVKGGLVALDGAATKLDKRITKPHGAENQLESRPKRAASEKKRPK